MASWAQQALDRSKTRIAGWQAQRAADPYSLENALRRDADTGRDAEDFYLDRATHFDPGAALQQYTTGAVGQFRTQLAQQLRDLAGQSVGAGRLDTGFYDEDQGRVVTELGSRLQDTLATKALDVTDMQQRNFENVGAFGSNKRQEFADLLVGDLDRKQAAANAKRQSRGGLLGGALGLAGTVLGGPIGGALGGAIGGLFSGGGKGFSKY